MRLTPLLAIILLSWLLVNLINAGPSRSRNTSNKCKGSSSRASTRCRPNVAKPTSTSNSNNSRTTRKPSTKLPTRKTTRSTRLPPKKKPTVRSKENDSGSTTSSSSKLPTRKTTRSTRLPVKKRPTVSSVSPTDEESDSVSTSNKIKASAKKYFQKVKSRLQEAAVWYVDNKDKTIDQILVERWREKGECSGAKSNKSKRKSCVSAALEESEDDTPEQKQVKDALKSLLEENPDDVYEFLSTSSSRTFRDIENEEETQDKLTPENSGLSTSNLRNLGARRKPSIKLPKKITRKPLPRKKRPTVRSEEKDSVSTISSSSRPSSRPTNVSSGSPTDDCQLPENGRFKRSPGAPGGKGGKSGCTSIHLRKPTKPTTLTQINPITPTRKKHFVDQTMLNNIFSSTGTGTGSIEDAVDILGEERWEALTATFDATQRQTEEFRKGPGKPFQSKNTVLSNGRLPLDLSQFTPKSAVQQGGKVYEAWESDTEIEFVQIEWVPNGTKDGMRENGHFKVTKMKGKIEIGVDDLGRGGRGVSHLKPLPGTTPTTIEGPVEGNMPYKYNYVDTHKNKGAGRGPGPGPG